MQVNECRRIPRGLYPARGIQFLYSLLSTVDSTGSQRAVASGLMPRAGSAALLHGEKGGLRSSRRGRLPALKHPSPCRRSGDPISRPARSTAAVGACSALRILLRALCFLSVSSVSRLVGFPAGAAPEGRRYSPSRPSHFLRVLRVEASRFHSDAPFRARFSAVGSRISRPEGAERAVVSN